MFSMQGCKEDIQSRSQQELLPWIPLTSQTLTHLSLQVAFVDQAQGHPPLEFPSLYFSEIAFVL